MGWELCLDPPFPDCTMYRREKPKEEIFYDWVDTTKKTASLYHDMGQNLGNPLIGVFFFFLMEKGLFPGFYRNFIYEKKRNQIVGNSQVRRQAILQGDSEIAEDWFDQAAEYWKQAIALTPGNYIEAQNWKVDLAGLFVCLVRKEEDLMIIRSSEPEVKIAVDRDPIKTSFEEWARPGHFSRTIAKGPDTTTWDLEPTC
ncbi:hypothetical protein ACJX0J_002254 [Zea mays]